MAKRIMVVDDAMFMRATVKRILEQGGYEVAGEAENGHIAIQKYAELKPDAVLMDITMPVMDGITAAKAILQIDPKAIVLMCTALGQQNMVIDAIKAGVKDYIVKPFQPERVIDGLGKALGAS
ncbi:MAG: response regulator [Armatimonadetes bacterium]|nr:response regulator [Armatimonadota bacterium]